MPNPSTYFAGYIESLAAKACIVDTSLPTFAGIASVTFQTDGSAVVTWAAATSTKTPVRYEIYVSPGSVSAGALFVTANRVAFAPGALLAWRIFVLRDQVTYFMPGQVYTFGIRAVDSQNFTDTNTVILTATALYPNYGTLAAVVWDQLTAAHTVAGSFGEMVEEINSDVDEIITTLGTPAGASVSADLAEIEAETDGIAAIPTNPLLTTDARLNHLDADISSRVATTHFDSVIGTPAGASVSADIAEIEAETDGIAAIPTNPLLTTDVRLNHLDADISSRVATAHFDSVIGTPAGASVSADIAEIEAETDGIAAIPTNPLLTTDSRLNHLDADISTREPSSDPRLAHLDADISSRLSAAGYTAPDNADIAAIKVQTDKMLFDGSSFIKANAEVTIDDPNIAAIKAKTDQLLFNVDTGVIAHVINVAPVDYEAVADAVWDEDTAEHTAPGTFGENAQTPAINPQQVANAVWDEPIASHLSPGSTGKKLNDGASGSGGSSSGCLGLTGSLDVQNLQGTLENVEIAGFISQVIDLNG